jgi:CrcB protein
MILAISVGCAGALGAVGRYIMDGAVQDRTRGVLPLGTLAVNVTGSLVIGLVAGIVLFHHVGPTERTIVGTGLCGGLTTWSTASWETLRLVEDGSLAAGILNAIGGLAASLVAAGLGLALAAVL